MDRRSLIGNGVSSRPLLLPDDVTANSVAFNPLDRTNLSSQDSTVVINEITVNNISDIISSTITNNTVAVVNIKTSKWINC